MKRVETSLLRLGKHLETSNFGILFRKHPFSAKKSNGISSKKKHRLLKQQHFGTEISSPHSILNNTWYTPSSLSSNKNSLEMGRYGLKRLDYGVTEPTVWTIPPHPPSKTLQERLVFPSTLIIVS